MRPASPWYAAPLRWLGSAFIDAAARLDRPSPEPMPRHTSFDEVLADVRNRSNVGFEAGHRPHYW